MSSIGATLAPMTSLELMTYVTSGDPRPRGTSNDQVTRLVSPRKVSERPSPREGSDTSKSKVSFSMYRGIYSAGGGNVLYDSLWVRI